MNNPYLTTAFIAAVTAFIKAQFPNLQNWQTVLVVAVVSIVFVLVAPFEAAFPAVTPFLDPIITVLGYVLGAAGGVSLVNYFIGKAK